jgi:TolB protein
MTIFILLLALLNMVIFTQAEPEKPVTLTIAPTQKAEKTKIALLVMNPTDTLNQLADLVARNLSWSNQKNTGFAVERTVVHYNPSKRLLRTLFAEGFALVLIISEGSNSTIEWRLYDPSTLTMCGGKRHQQRATLTDTVHAVADAIWQTLTGKAGLFSTKIAYCREFRTRKGPIKHIYVTAPQENQPAVLVKHGKPLAPRWHSDPGQRLLLYSDITSANVRLMSVDPIGKCTVVSNFDGLNILPSFSPDGTKMVYCLSDEHGMGIYCYTQEPGAEGSLKKLPIPAGNNISPTVLDSGDVIFCSDANGINPRIYYYHADTKAIERITTDGYCSSPAWCPATKTIAYCRLVSGIMQVFTYDMTSRRHTQLTFGRGNKDECCWSPCGTYVAFEEQGRIALVNLATQEQFYLTPLGQHCCYPSWSPHFG